MIYLSGFIILLVYLYLFKKQREILKLIPISHKGIINLYRVFNTNNSLSLYKLYFNIIAMFGFIIFMAIAFKLNMIFTITLIIVSVLLLPLIVVWRLNYQKQEYNFNNLIIYINQFIMVFKTYPKIYPTLIEIENTVSGQLNSLVNNSIENIKNGHSSFDSLNAITIVYPHFIIHNLHSLAYSIEQYGTTEYYEALDLIQDDVDDWVEDVAAYNYNKNKIITKLTVLIIFALFICFMALKMILSIDIEISVINYQISIFIFCLVQIITYVTSISVLNSKWIESSESL